MILICHFLRWIKTHIRHYILTRFKFGCTAREIHIEVCDAWSDDAVSYNTVAEWVQRFRQGRVSLEDDPRSGRPGTEATDRKTCLWSSFEQQGGMYSHG